MGLNDTPSGERIHIGFFGKRNAGKSSLVNAFTGQELAVVSDTPGTTTDPVRKAMELLPLGPVMIIDTPGYDDEGELGLERVKRTKKVLNMVDIALLVLDATKKESEAEKELQALFQKRNVPYIKVYNKCDLLDTVPEENETELYVSAKDKTNIERLKEKVSRLVVTGEQTHKIVGDIINEGELALLVIPIDKAAPKGRLILPQQQVIRDILESGAAACTVRETELKYTMENLVKKPSIVITDSQVFKYVNEVTPQDIRLTSFSILMARYKGFLEMAVEGASKIKALKNGDKVLIAEGCTHHRQCGDIGSVKLPNMLKKFTGKELEIELSSGTGFPEELSDFSLIIHCGGCMLGAKDVMYRMKCALDSGVPVTNYGIALAYMQGILKRTIEIFPGMAEKMG